ncbi:hypothetical protein T310_1692 [Rasamsonia emersonii CBS 393.64]|uniref:CTP synthase (glutamine hydrolyzing) n=1 Tax=Rasamsonia emersonii (strain ATCC 16479 / CBS 393.64 / IMI 116815) TaxID=1408163 RepID=A0A0F4Z179_RASE3|nr:hypothetical protein T310_1692 [Rasamsonia emersonii CBS 393.64]KKA24259.1 hypothetical protein T310_1692 [Rasamsonia emersonii CBS 393.64]
MRKFSLSDTQGVSRRTAQIGEKCFSPSRQLYWDSKRVPSRPVLHLLHLSDFGPHCVIRGTTLAALLYGRWRSLSLILGQSTGARVLASHQIWYSPASLLFVTANFRFSVCGVKIDKTKMGGTMRLGKRPTIFQPGTEWSRLRKLYGEKKDIWERHRHRYEVNPKMVETPEKAGLTFIRKDEKGERMEIIELKDHKWYVGVCTVPS